MKTKPFTKASSALQANPSTVRAVNWYLERKRSSLENRRDGRFLDRMERRLARSVRIRFGKQVVYLLRELKEFDFFKEDGKGARIMTKAQLNNNFKLLMDNMPEREGLVNDIEENAKIAILRGGRTSARRTNTSLARLKGVRSETKTLTVSFDLRNPETQRYLSELRTIHLSNYRGSIDKTTRDGVLNVIKRGVDDGVSYTEMAKRIRAQTDSGVFSKARAEMIAVNQLAKAYEHGNSQPPLQAMQETGEDMFKSWSTVGDDKVTEQCQANENEQWLPMLEEFRSGDAHAPRGSHPRCRCATLYEFSSVLAQQGLIDPRTVQNPNATAAALDTPAALPDTIEVDGTAVDLPTGYLYHGTRAQNIGGIAASGLLPRVSDLDDEARVYLGVNPAVTGTGLGMDDADVLMRVRGDVVSDAHLDPHIPSNLALFTQNGIKPEDIEVRESTGSWVPLLEFLRRLKG